MVVYPPPFGEAPLSDDALFDEGRRLLADTPQVDGQVSLLCAPHSVALSNTGGAERPPAEQRSIPDLSRAVAAFQPQLCCHTGAVTGFEILARLDHPERGLIGPADFLPMLPPARQRQLTRLMLGQGLAALRQWDSAGFDVGTVSLNVSTADLVAHDFADVVLWELDRQDVSAHRLVIEVMEDLSPMDLPERVRSNLDRLAASGCSVDLDDFGTGYAGLDALRRLHVRRVKIDRSFITACDHDHDQQQMILAILALADHLGLQTLAEGVETAAEHSFVAQIGCTHAQGYAIARPLALAQTIGFLAERRARQEALPMIRRRA